MDLQASPSRLARSVPVLLLFSLTALPTDAFILLLLLSHFCTCAARTAVWQSTPDNNEHEKDPSSPPPPPFHTTILPRTSSLLWTSVFLLSLPCILSALAFVLQASSRSIIDLSKHIPAQNPLAAIAFECAFMAFRASKWVRHMHSAR